MEEYVVRPTGKIVIAILAILGAVWVVKLAVESDGSWGAKVLAVMCMFLAIGYWVFWVVAVIKGPRR